MERHEKENTQHITDRFCNATCLTNIARLLRFSPKNLAYILYELDGGREGQYEEFEIPKRSGGTRAISAPTTALKEVQARLNSLLQYVYWEKPCVHSFIANRSAKTNALRHCGRKFVFNIDLQDFFPSINFGRVRGLFMGGPYNLPPEAATVIAQIACYKNELPQGAPSSPIISNMICSKMDSELIALAQKQKCFYSRYADDISFSTNLNKFPESIGGIVGPKAIAGKKLAEIIDDNGFKINPDKVKLQSSLERQEVTGLIVNEFVNVRRKSLRQVRAMIHAWKKFGLEKAETEYYDKYCDKTPAKEDFQAVLRGKIEFIAHTRKSKRKALIHKAKGLRGEDISTRLLRRFFELQLTEAPHSILYTEGPTDWMHLNAAWKQLKAKRAFKGMEFTYFKSQHEMCCGESNLLSFCNQAKKLIRPPKNKIICIFDNDVQNVKKAHGNGKFPFKYWGNNVYSFILPPPSGYKGKTYSIEMFYGDKFIKNAFDAEKRRLFLSSEFNPKTLKLKADPKILYGINPRTGKKKSNAQDILKGDNKILDSLVVSKTATGYSSLALSKKYFAINILKEEGDFAKASFNEFGSVFKVIKDIIADKPK